MPGIDATPSGHRQGPNPRRASAGRHDHPGRETHVGHQESGACRHRVDIGSGRRRPRRAGSDQSSRRGPSAGRTTRGTVPRGVVGWGRVGCLRRHRRRGIRRIGQPVHLRRPGAAHLGRRSRGNAGPSVRPARPGPRRVRRQWRLVQTRRDAERAHHRLRLRQVRFQRVRRPGRIRKDDRLRQRHELRLSSGVAGRAQRRCRSRHGPRCPDFVATGSRRARTGKATHPATGPARRRNHHREGRPGMGPSGRPRVRARFRGRLASGRRRGADRFIGLRDQDLHARRRSGPGPEKAVPPGAGDEAREGSGKGPLAVGSDAGPRGSRWPCRGAGGGNTQDGG